MVAMDSSRRSEPQQFRSITVLRHTVFLGSKQQSRANITDLLSYGFLWMQVGSVCSRCVRFRSRIGCSTTERPRPANDIASAENYSQFIRESSFSVRTDTSPIRF